MTRAPTQADVDARLATALEAAAAAGSVAESARGMGVDRWIKACGGIVTSVDVASERAAVEVIREAFPDDDVVAEEAGRLACNGGGAWYVDAIDGTSNYMKGSPEYATSIAFLSGDHDVGVVRAPGLGIVWSAVTGGLGSGPAARTPPVPGSLVVATGFSTDPSLHREQLDLVGRLLAGGAHVREPGSAALGIARVVQGHHDAYVELGVRMWDIAAGVVIARGAGMHVEVRPSAREHADVFVCAPDAVDELRDTVDEAR